MHLKRLSLALLLCAVLLLGGCGSQPSAGSGKQQDPPVTLTALQYELENRAVDFNQLWFFQEIEAQTGVHVDFTAVRDSEWASGVSLAFARGNLPDMILRGSLDVEEYGVSRHLLLPLDEYLAQGFLPNYASRLEEENLREQLTASDGHIYQLGFLISQGVNTDGHFFINQDWLDALSLPVPATVNELTETLRRFRDEDPNRNGLRDEIPMEFTFDDNNTGIYNLFSFFSLPLNEDYVYLQDGIVRFAPEADEFIEALEWMHLLAEEGLLDLDFLSQGSNIWSAKVNEGNVGMFSYWRLQNTALSPDITGMYRIMKPVHAENRAACLPRLIDLVEFGAALTVDNHDVEASLKWLDAQFETENMLVSQNGPVGDTLIRQADGRYAVAYVPQGNELYQRVPVICGQFFAPAAWYNEVYIPAAHREEKAAYCAMYEDAGVLEPVSCKLLTNVASKTAEEDAQLSRLKARLKSIIDSAIVDMVTTGVTPEKIAEMHASLQEAGSGTYAATWQQVYDRYTGSH